MKTAIVVALVRLKAGESGDWAGGEEESGRRRQGTVLG